MCETKKLKKVLELLVQSYRDVYGSNIMDIILYGSYARGDYTEESDIDVVAVVHGTRIELQKKLKNVWDCAAEIGLENDVILSPTVITYDEFVRYRNTLPYYKNIAEEGKKIG